MVRDEYGSDRGLARARASLGTGYDYRRRVSGIFEEPQSGDERDDDLGNFIANDDGANEASSSSGGSIPVRQSRDPPFHPPTLTPSAAQAKVVSPSERRRERFNRALESSPEPEPQSSGDGGEPLVLSVRSPSTAEVGPSQMQGKQQRGNRRASDAAVISDGDDDDEEPGPSSQRPPTPRRTPPERKTARSRRRKRLGYDRIAEARADPSTRRKLNLSKRVVIDDSGSEDSGDAAGWKVGRTLPEDTVDSSASE